METATSNGRPSGPARDIPPIGSELTGCYKLDSTLQRIVGRLENPTPADQARAAELSAREARQREEEAQQARAQLAGAMGKRYARCRLDNYAIEHNAQRPIVEALRDYAARFPEVRERGAGVVLFGPPGTGKDHLLAGLAWEVFDKHRVAPMFAHGLDLFGDVRDRIGSDEQEGEIIARFGRAAVLVLSDPLPPRGALTDWQAGVLLRILDRRYRMMLPTWVSMNVANGAEADERLGAQAVDRLKDGAVVGWCSWPSYRRVAEAAK